MGRPRFDDTAHEHDNMNTLVLLPLLAASCVVAPTSSVVALHGAFPLGGVVATHSVTHNVPSAVEYAAAPVPVVYSGANLNIPAPIPQGVVGPQNVQTFKVKALGRPVVSYTPQITEVRPELNIVERVYDVAVPKPVYQT